MRKSAVPAPDESSSRPLTFAERLARRERHEAIARGDAVLVGSRAGVVEWADEAWTRLTGFPLDETVDKPITHFLDHARLERELVEFVAHHFREGRPCTVALPFDTFDGRRIDVTLEVERWRDEASDSSRFIAVVREATPPSPSEPPPASTSDPAREAGRESGRAPHPEVPHGESTRTAGPAARLEPIVAEAASAGRPGHGAVRAFDVHVAPATHLRATPARPIRPILDALLEATHAALDDDPAWVSVVAGPLEAGRSHHSLVHPIPNRAVASRTRPGCYVEVHDTAPHLEGSALERIRSRKPGASPRERALSRAANLAEAAGLALHLDSTPGCGTQALLALDRADV